MAAFVEHDFTFRVNMLFYRLHTRHTTQIQHVNTKLNGNMIEDWILREDNTKNHAFGLIIVADTLLSPTMTNQNNDKYPSRTHHARNTVQVNTVKLLTSVLQ
jgi:hypothetical protein